MATRAFSFLAGDNRTLAGNLETPTGPVRAWAVFAHCFTCSRESVGAVRVSRALAARGIGVLRFDFTGLGESEGEFGAAGFSRDLEDLEAACAAMAADGKTPSLLVGHSLGGAAVLHGANRIASIQAVATLGAPADPEHTLRHLGEARERIASEGEGEAKIGGRSFRITNKFIREMEDQPWEERIRGLRRPLLILHAPEDEVVGIEQAARIYAAAMHPKSFISLDGADHLLKQRADADWAAEMISSWASRYIPEGKTSPAAADAEEVVSETPGDGLRTHLSAGPHALVADEPESVGGENSGPTPYGLLSSALAACTGMTLAMYARHKQLPLTRTRVRVRHDRIHASDCEACESSEGRVDRFQRSIEIEGELSREQRQRLIEIADRCPVHRTLENEIRIETREESGEA